MNIEQKMACIRRALEMGARVSINIHHISEKEKAEEVIKMLSDMTHIPYEMLSNNGAQWFQTRDYQNGISAAVFFKVEEEEETA